MAIAATNWECTEALCTAINKLCEMTQRAAFTVAAAIIWHAGAEPGAGPTHTADVIAKARELWHKADIR